MMSFGTLTVGEQDSHSLTTIMLALSRPIEGEPLSKRELQLRGVAPDDKHFTFNAAMESYPLPYAQSTAYLSLYAVRNAAELRSRLVAASQLPDDERGNEERRAVDFAFVDAKMVRVGFYQSSLSRLRLSPGRGMDLTSMPQITSRLHALTAVQQALLARADGTLKTKTVHSEVLWMLEPGSNVGDRPFRFPSNLIS